MPEKTIIHTSGAPEPGPYSQAVKYGDQVFVAGQTSENPATNEPVHDSVKKQTEIILENIRTILEASGTSLSKVVRADVFLSDMKYKDEMNKVFKEFFPGDPPARNTVAVKGIDDGLDVEIEVIAGI